LIDKIVSRIGNTATVARLVRARESSLIVLAALVGAIAGPGRVRMGTGVDLLHRVVLSSRSRACGCRDCCGSIRSMAISVPLAGGSFSASPAN
jgi:hypothetical protein